MERLTLEEMDEELALILAAMPVAKEDVRRHAAAYNVACDAVRAENRRLLMEDPWSTATAGMEVPNREITTNILLTGDRKQEKLLALLKVRDEAYVPLEAARSRCHGLIQRNEQLHFWRSSTLAKNREHAGVRADIQRLLTQRV